MPDRHLLLLIDPGHQAMVPFERIDAGTLAHPTVKRGTGFGPMPGLRVRRK